jgi:hypothetical protein
VLDVIENQPQPRMLMVIPEIIHVANRRQFERTNATVASQVRVWVGPQPAPTVGLLANVSADGLACNLPGTALDEVLALGDQLRVQFELAGFDGVFELTAVLCNKVLISDRQQLSLGMKFEVGHNRPADQQALERLRAALAELMANTTDMDGEL